MDWSNQPRGIILEQLNITQNDLLLVKIMLKDLAYLDDGDNPALWPHADKFLKAQEWLEGKGRFKL